MLNTINSGPGAVDILDAYRWLTVPVRSRNVKIDRIVDCYRGKGRIQGVESARRYLHAADADIRPIDVLEDVLSIEYCSEIYIYHW